MEQEAEVTEVTEVRGDVRLEAVKEKRGEIVGLSGEFVCVVSFFCVVFSSL